MNSYFNEEKNKYCRYFKFSCREKLESIISSNLNYKNLESHIFYRNNDIIQARESLECL